MPPCLADAANLGRDEVVAEKGRPVPNIPPNVAARVEIAFSEEAIGRRRVAKWTTTKGPAPSASGLGV
jgi:hypothetical protein